jgi:hypothetical protein
MNPTIEKLYQKINKIKEQMYIPTKVILGENQYQELIQDVTCAVPYLLTKNKMIPMFQGIPVTRSYRRENYLCVLSNKPKQVKSRKSYLLSDLYYEL